MLTTAQGVPGTYGAIAKSSERAADIEAKLNFELPAYTVIGPGEETYPGVDLPTVVYAYVYIVTSDMEGDDADDLNELIRQAFIDAGAGAATVAPPKQIYTSLTKQKLKFTISAYWSGPDVSIPI